jgi:GcrA cell cycle regulator
MGWTEERIAELTRLVAQGESASEIAAALGWVTRNAVIGKMMRLGLVSRSGLKAARDRPLPKMPRERAPRPPKPERAPRPFQLLPVSVPKPPTPPPAPRSPTASSRILADLEPRHCRFPLDDPGAGNMEHTLFCAEAVAEDQRYCPSHRAMCFQPEKPRPIRLPRAA